MTEYFITFRITDNASYERRYNALYEAVREITNGLHWIETTSFFAFQSNLSTDDIVARVRKTIDERTDLILLSAFSVKICRIIGHVTDREIFDMVAFAKKE